jgi:integrase
MAKLATQFPGVRCRPHKTRKFSGKLDRYFFIRYRYGGQLKEEGIGWASEGWNAQKASIVLTELKKNHLTGEGPQTLSEKRAAESERREAEKAAEEKNKKDAITFSNYFTKRYFPEAETNKHWRSSDREESLVRLWVAPVIGKMPFKDIRPFHLEQIKKNMGDGGKAARSIQYALAVVRQVFNHAIKNDIFKGDNPARKVGKPKVDNRRIRFLTRKEADLLLQKLMARSPQLHDIALLSLHCGLRAGEIFELTWGCIEFQNGSIFLLDTKSGKNRTVYMTNQVKEILSTRTVGKPTDLVFQARKGKKIKEVSNAFDKVIEDLGFNMGIQDKRLTVCFHTLRHTYASWLVQAGVDLYRVKNLLGHSVISMTERYAHLAPESAQEAARVFNSIVKKKPTAESKRSKPVS